MPTFVFNDETQVNSYGFRIPNKGINLSRFKANPVMLDQHYNSTRAVLGKWKTIRVDGTQLKGDSDFDSEDADAAKVEGKVDRGYIKGASMGVTFNREHMKLNPDGTWELTQCELYEVSIVAVPSNRNSLTLFAENGEILSDDEVKLSISQLTTDLTIKDNNTNKQKMEKIILSAPALVALGLNQIPENSTDLSAAVEKLAVKLSAVNTDLENEKSAHEVTKGKLQDQAKLQATALVSQALLEGKITADEEANFVKDATNNYELTAKLLSRIPAKVTLGGKVVTQTLSDGPKTMDEFEKLSDDAKLTFKKENPDAYKALFK
ncbi:MAG: HK97 family phage prohead protease [Arcticibacter sp.]